MYVYWTLGLAVSILTKFSSMCFEKKEKHFIFTLIGLLIGATVVFSVCFFAGARDPYSVGTDTAGYCLTDFINGCDLSWDTFTGMAEYKRYPLLCKLLIWGTAHFSRNLFIYLFVLEFVTFIPVFIVVMKWSKKYSWLGVFIFVSFMLPKSFNTIRQSMAEAFCFVALYMCIKRKPIFSALFIVLGWQFHHSALVCVFYLPIYYYLKTYKYIGSKKLWVKCFVVVFVAFISIIFAHDLLLMAFKDDENWGYYVNSTVSLNSFTVIFLLLAVFIFAFLFYIIKKKPSENEYFNIVYMLVIFAVAVAAQALGTQFQWLFRIAYYYYIVWMLLFPKMCDIVIGKHEKILIWSIALIFILGFSYVHYEVKGFDEVVPYNTEDNFSRWF